MPSLRRQEPLRRPAPDHRVTAEAPSDELPNPLESKRRELKEKAITDVIAGRAQPQERNGSTVVKVGETSERGRGSDKGHRDQYVELENEGTDRVFTLLVEFGNQRHPDYPDQDTDPDTPGPARFDGPLHNEIPEPDRTVDNTTHVAARLQQRLLPEPVLRHRKGRRVTEDLLREAVVGPLLRVAATPPLGSPFRTTRRATAAPTGLHRCDDIVCDNTWNLVEDGMNPGWTRPQAAGRTPAQIKAELATYDIHDRYDFDGDGNFNEPDGYVDHLQIVHAGGDQADGDPHPGRGRHLEPPLVRLRHRPRASPARQATRHGGKPVGDTGIWAGDYTIQAENSGLSTIAHEYGHDLGLPDHYDTAGGQNGVEWWTLMAQSRLNAKGEPIGTRAGDLSAWDKLQLGWLDYEVVVAGQTRTARPRADEYNSPKAQGVVVVLPDKTVTDEYGDPFAGERMWWSGKGDDLENTMTQEVDLTGVVHRGARPEGPLRDRSRVRLPVRAGVDGRHHVDQPRRHGRRRAVHPRRQRPTRHRRVVGG